MLFLYISWHDMNSKMTILISTKVSFKLGKQKRVIVLSIRFSLTSILVRTELGCNARGDYGRQSR